MDIDSKHYDTARTKGDHGIWGRQKTTLTRFCFLTTNLPLVDIFDGFSLILYSKIYVLMTFHLLPTYLLLST